MTRMFFPYSFYPFKAIENRIFFSLKLNPLGHFILGMIFMITILQFPKNVRYLFWFPPFVHIVEMLSMLGLIFDKTRDTCLN